MKLSPGIESLLKGYTGRMREMIRWLILDAEWNHEAMKPQPHPDHLEIGRLWPQATKAEIDHAIGVARVGQMRLTPRHTIKR
jgi:hypothetical protein